MGCINTIAAVVTALSTLALAIVTCLLAGFAWLQVRSARDEAKRSRTLATCEKYDLDPFLDKNLRTLRDAHDDDSFRRDPTPYRSEVLTVLNYFESIAIGVQRDLYDVAIIRDHFSQIFQDHFLEYFGPNAPKMDWLTLEDFELFRRLCEDWSREDHVAPKPK
jgi:hypothetical protein